jgi:hypothetical protein
MAVLPKQVDVRTNGTVAVKTFLLTFHIDGIVRAYQAGVGREDFLRPRIRFSTSFQDRVVIRRNHGKWDVVVTPEDPVGFINAVERMVRDTGTEEGEVEPNSIDNTNDDEDDNHNDDDDNNKTDFVVVAKPSRKIEDSTPDLASRLV